MQSELKSQLDKLGAIAPHFQQLLADPLSDISRERQKWLVAGSFICILLSKKIVKLSKVSGIGFEFRPDAQTSISLLMAMVCLCLLIIFSTSVYQDFTLFAFRVQPSQVAVARFALLLNEESNSKTRRATEALDRLSTLKVELEDLLSINHLTDAGKERFTKLSGLIVLAADDVWAASTHLDAALNKILGMPTLQTLTGRARLFVEVLSPIVLGAVAIWFALAKGWLFTSRPSHFSTCRLDRQPCCANLRLCNVTIAARFAGV